MRAKPSSGGWKIDVGILNYLLLRIGKISIYFRDSIKDDTRFLMVMLTERSIPPLTEFSEIESVRSAKAELNGFH